MIYSVSRLPRCAGCGARIANYDWSKHGVGVIEWGQIWCKRCEGITPPRGISLNRETYGDGSDDIVDE